MADCAQEDGEAASSKLFTIPELLEQIFLETRIKGILINAQRVEQGDQF